MNETAATETKFDIMAKTVSQIDIECGKLRNLSVDRISIEYQQPVELEVMREIAARYKSRVTPPDSLIDYHVCALKLNNAYLILHERKEPLY